MYCVLSDLVIYLVAGGTAAIDPDEENNSEVEEWEEQQIKKAMPAIIDITGNIYILQLFLTSVLISKDYLIETVQNGAVIHHSFL